MDDRSNDEIMAGIFAMDDSDLDHARKMREHLVKAVSHLIQGAKDRVGLEIEMADWGVEHNRTLSIGDDDQELKSELFQTLFSCHVAETILEINVSGREYPFLSSAVAGELGIPDRAVTEAKFC